MTAMFLRSVKARGRKGEKHEYLRLVESYREGGKNKQRVVLNLGRRDVLTPHLASLVRMLQDKEAEGNWIRAAEVITTEAACWGSVLVAKILWDELGIDYILDGCQGKKSRGASLGERVFVLVANRMCCPGSAQVVILSRTCSTR